MTTEAYVWRLAYALDPQLDERIHRLYFGITASAHCNDPRLTARLVKEYQL